MFGAAPVYISALLLSLLFEFLVLRSVLIYFFMNKILHGSLNGTLVFYFFSVLLFLDKITRSLNWLCLLCFCVFLIDEVSVLSN